MADEKVNNDFQSEKSGSESIADKMAKNAAANLPKPDKSKNQLEFLADVPMNISAELGATELTIKDLLQLSVSSVIELNKLAGEPLEFLINGRTVARGEVIVVNDKYGIRLTDIVGSEDNNSKVDPSAMI
jgi:flagellar motor switch protein FliN